MFLHNSTCQFLQPWPDCGWSLWVPYRSVPLWPPDLVNKCTQPVKKGAQEVNTRLMKTLEEASYFPARSGGRSARGWPRCMFSCVPAEHRCKWCQTAPDPPGSRTDRAELLLWTCRHTPAWFSCYLQLFSHIIVVVFGFNAAPVLPRHDVNDGISGKKNNIIFLFSK